MTSCVRPALAKSLRASAESSRSFGMPRKRTFVVSAICWMLADGIAPGWIMAATCRLRKASMPAPHGSFRTVKSLPPSSPLAPFTMPAAMTVAAPAGGPRKIVLPLKSAMDPRPESARVTTW